MPQHLQVKRRGSESRIMNSEMHNGSAGLREAHSASDGFLLSVIMGEHMTKTFPDEDIPTIATDNQLWAELARAHASPEVARLPAETLLRLYPEIGAYGPAGITIAGLIADWNNGGKTCFKSSQNNDITSINKFFGELPMSNLLGRYTNFDYQVVEVSVYDSLNMLNITPGEVTMNETLGMFFYAISWIIVESLIDETKLISVDGITFIEEARAKLKDVLALMGLNSYDYLTKTFSPDSKGCE